MLVVLVCTSLRELDFCHSSFIVHSYFLRKLTRRGIDEGRVASIVTKLTISL